jgi:hypothetical protein|tara:strand:- start:13097 stop:13408 length:312 start_codon:yes stop_codon:yes gene_type:complete
MHFSQVGIITLDTLERQVLRMSNKPGTEIPSAFWTLEIVDLPLEVDGQWVIPRSLDLQVLEHKAGVSLGGEVNKDFLLGTIALIRQDRGFRPLHLPVFNQAPY